MFGAGHPPAFPRMSTEDAAAIIGQISGLGNDALVRRSTTSVYGASFYETATSRITAEDLSTVQHEVRALAKAHGYPTRLLRGQSLEFDQSLTVLLAESLNILPADAADEGVWSFFTLNVCPDVALWRFPNDADEEGTVREKYERLLGKPRNVFRRAWWRGYVLGKELSSLLLEDESVQIMERPAIGGSQRVARAVASTHLRHVDAGSGGSRQDLLRESIKRLRRKMGQISIHALPDGEMAAVIDTAFDEAISSMVQAKTAPRNATPDAIASFKTSVAEIWPFLESSVIEVPWSQMSGLEEALQQYQTTEITNENAAMKIVADLLSLVQGWNGYTGRERSVVHAAVVYFLMSEDFIPDHLPAGLDDDDLVVAAAFSALNLVRD